MTFHFVKAAEKYSLSSLASLAEAGADIRVALVKTNNAVSVRATAQFMGDVTFTEYAGSGYTRQALATQTITVDAANFRTELTAAANVWNPLGADSGTNPMLGALVYIHVTNDADSPVLAYYDDGGFPTNGTGSPFTLNWSSEGLIQFDCPLS